jgi:diketogulonate reductase-like aldo/keto reductase
MPWVGLGVFQSPPGQTTYQTVLEALRVGYRHIDTAAIYRNEKDVGRAIRESGIPRSDIFVTTKLWNDKQGFEKAQKGLILSLKELGLDYVNLYLIHWPVPKLRLESWKALIQLKKEGLAKSIGVSNFMLRHLEELLESSDEVPAVDQVEFSPFLSQSELLAFCEKNDIQMEAYSPLTKGMRLNHPALLSIASKHKKSTAQVLIRWCIQKKVVVIPKSNQPERISENFQVFDFILDNSDMRVLDSLNENLHTGWNPKDE